MSKEVMKLALSTLEGWANYDDWVWPESALEQAKRNTIEAITALRQALEPEQEPVLWLKTWSDGSVSVLKTKSHAFADHELESLYTAPPKKQWVGLTDEEVSDVIDGVLEGGGWLDVARALEAAIKDKNKW